MNESVKSAGSVILSTVALSAGKKILKTLGFAGAAKLALVAGAGYLAYEYLVESKKESPKET